METFDEWYDRQPLVLLDRKTEHRMTWEAAQEVMIERCACVCDALFEQRGIDCAAAIRALKDCM